MTDKVDMSADLSRFAQPRALPARLTVEGSETRRLTILRLRALIVSEFYAFDPVETIVLNLLRFIPRHSFSFVRTSILRALGIKIGVRSRVHGPLRLTGPRNRRKRLEVGTGSVLAGSMHIDLGAAVHIGSGVHIGPDVALLTVDHEIGPPERRCGPHAPAPIWIGDGAWIGARVMVLPGVRIGAGAVVAAGALVTRNVPPNTLVGGVPARKIRELPTSPEHEFATHNPSWV